MTNKKRTAILSVRIPEELKKHFATIALKEQISLSDKINKILEQEYENNTTRE